MIDDEESPQLIVHRDLGPSFAHRESLECPCCPMIYDLSDGVTADDITADIERRQRPQ